jgi:polysaccharide biosynthesis/export protein
MTQLSAGKKYLMIALLLGAFVAPGSAQQPVSNDAKKGQGSASPRAVGGPVAPTQIGVSKGNPSEAAPTVRIGPGDELDITVFGLPELSQHVRVSNAGDVSMPLVGTVHLAGLSSDEAQSLFEKLLADGNYVNNPHVTVYVKEYTTEGISLIGEVARPGVYPAIGAHRLMDLIQTAGGLTEKSGKTVTVSHRADPEHPVILALSDDAIKMAQNNIDLLPGDTVVVSKAGIVYVVGEVNRPGGFVLEGNNIMASEALAMAAGPTRLASLNRTRVIRRTSEGLKDTPLPLSKVLEAKSPDVALQANDIVYVPESRIKGAISAGNVVSLLASAAIYRF